MRKRRIGIARTLLRSTEIFWGLIYHIDSSVILHPAAVFYENVGSAHGIHTKRDAANIHLQHPKTLSEITPIFDQRRNALFQRLYALFDARNERCVVEKNT